MKKSKEQIYERRAMRTASQDFRKEEHRAPLNEEDVKQYCEGRKRNLRFR